ncbi:hypothetical protein NicSoilB8_26130 [Arthrobacter sp. NicSoilB8]|nr:hypothetical protein NicSoilB8_26130 [Arthrobacter sp. NicSoilB8]
MLAEVLVDAEFGGAKARHQLRREAECQDGNGQQDAQRHPVTDLGEDPWWRRHGGTYGIGGHGGGSHRGAVECCIAFNGGGSSHGILRLGTRAPGRAPVTTLPPCH